MPLRQRLGRQRRQPYHGGIINGSAGQQQGFLYTVHLRMADSKLFVNDQWGSLLPSMLVSAEVKTGST